MQEPLRASRLPPVPEDAIYGLMEPIVRHIRDVLARGDATDTEFILDFVCRMIQRPLTPVRVALVLYGPSGCGKGILFEFLRARVLGMHNNIGTASPTHNILNGRKHPASCILAQVDEGFLTHMRALAQLVLKRDTVTALVCTTQHFPFVPPKTSDAFKVVRCAATPPNAYFRALADHLARDDVARACYQYAMRYNADTTPTQDHMPRFLSALVNAAPTRAIAGMTLFAMYKAHTGDKRITAASFGHRLHHSWRYLVRKQRNGSYRIDDVDALREMLIYYGDFHADATL